MFSGELGALCQGRYDRLRRSALGKEIRRQICFQVGYCLV